MRAGIDEDADITLLVTYGKDGLPSERSSNVIAGLLQLTFMTNVDPDPLPNVLHLQIENRRVCIDAAVHLAGSAGIELEQRLKRLRGNAPIGGVVMSGPLNIKHLIRLFDRASLPRGRSARRPHQRAKDIQRGSLLPASYSRRFARRKSNCERRKLVHSPRGCHRSTEGFRAGNAPETPASHLVRAIVRECHGPPARTHAGRPAADPSWRIAAGRPLIALQIWAAKPKLF